MRLLVASACLASACARPEPIKLVLPEEALGARTLVVALAETSTVHAMAFDMDVATTDQIAALLPSILEWDHTPAVYTVLAFSSSPAELDLRVGPPNAAASDAKTLPEPSMSFHVDIAEAVPEWRKDLPIAAAVGALKFPTFRGPIDCKEAVSRPLTPHDRSLDLYGLAVTAPNTAVVSGISVGPGQPSVPVMIEVRPDDTVIPRALPPNVALIKSLATDGEHVWGADEAQAVHVFDLRGNHLRSGAAGAMRRVVRSTLGKVFGYNAEGVFAFTDGSTIAEPLAGTGFPADVQHLAIHDASRMVLVNKEPNDLPFKVYVLHGGEWRSSFAATGNHDVVQVAIDEDAYYAITAAEILHKPQGEAWEVLMGNGSFEKLGILAFGQGRLVAHGVNGFLDVRPRAPPPNAWCLVGTGTDRYVTSVAVDPTRTTIMTLDDHGGGRESEGSLLLRVRIPR